jgi:hypothetical protein
MTKNFICGLVTASCLLISGQSNGDPASCSKEVKYKDGALEMTEVVLTTEHDRIVGLAVDACFGTGQEGQGGCCGFDTKQEEETTASPSGSSPERRIVRKKTEEPSQTVTWERDGNKTNLTLDYEGNKSKVVITKQGAAYTVDFIDMWYGYCGHWARGFPKSVRLEKGKTECVVKQSAL